MLEIICYTQITIYSDSFSKGLRRDSKMLKGFIISLYFLSLPHFFNFRHLFFVCLFLVLI